MKKTIVLVFLTVFSMSLSAQLPSKVLDLTLGVTTFENAEKSFEKKSLEYDSDWFGTEMEVEKVVYEGITWTKVKLEFYDSKLMEIEFIKNTSTSNKAEISKDFQGFNQKFTKKYADYFSEKMLLGDLVYKDKKTEVEYHYYDDAGVFSLTYSDIKLSEKCRQKSLELEEEEWDW